MFSLILFNLLTFKVILFFVYYFKKRASEAEIIASRDAAQVGHEWERVAKLCDFNPKANKNTKDVTRMRSILLQLKAQPLVR